MNSKRLKYFQEIANKKNKNLLIEKSIYAPKQEDIEIFEKTQLVESSNGKTYECRATLKNIPVSKYTENDNGRIYMRELFENVLKSGRAEGSDCFGNHAEGEPSVFDTVGIWHNFRVGENNPFADLYCIGDYGQLLAEKAKAGGKIGFSTVGYGEFLEDNKTVNPDTFELSHLADWVVEPSQGVYATIENISESVEKNKVSFIEEDTNKIEETHNSPYEDNNGEVKEIMDKFAEANHKNHVNKMIQEAKEQVDIKKGIQILENIDVADNSGLRDKVDNTIFELQNKLDDQRKNAVKAFEDLTTQYGELQEKYKTTCETLDQLKENYNKVKSVVEKSGKVEEGTELDVSAQKLQEERDTLIENEKNMKADIEQLTEDRDNMEADINQFEKDRKAMQEDIDQLLGDRKMMESDISLFIEERKVMKSDIKTLIEKYNKAVGAIKKLKEEMETDEEEEPDMVDDDMMAAVSEDESEGNEEKPYEFSFGDEEEEEIEEPEMEEQESEVEEEPFEEIPPMEDEEVVEQDQEEYEEIPVEEPEMEEEDTDEPEVEEEPGEEEPGEEEEIVPENEPEREEELAEQEDGSPEEVFDDILTDTDENEELSEPVYESIFNKVKKSKVREKRVQSKKVVEKKKVEILFEEEVKKTPGLKDIKEQILKSKDEKEAKSKISKFKESKNKKESPLKLSESAEEYIPDWLRGARGFEYKIK